MLTMNSKSGNFCPLTVKISESLFLKTIAWNMIALSHKEIYFWLSQDHEYGYLHMHRKPAQTIVLIVAVKV